MDLTLSIDQLALQETARRFVADYPDPDWLALAELGWVGLNTPERFGGSAATRADMAIVFEELGRGAVPGPIFESAVLVPEIVEAVARQWSAELLPAIAGGAARVVVLADGLFDTRRSFGITADNTVSGSSVPRMEFGDATHYLVLDSTSCALIDGSDGSIRVDRLSGFLPQSTVVNFAGTPADVIRNIAPGVVGNAVARSLPLLSAYQVGSCQAVFEMSMRYSVERVQFGKAIGTFQRVQDHIIQLINVTESARWATNFAVWHTDIGTDYHQPVHVAKAITAESHVAACTSAHEVHAGIGADLQYGLARHTYASRSLYSFLGDPRWHRRQLLSTLEL